MFVSFLICCPPNNLGLTHINFYFCFIFQYVYFSVILMYCFLEKKKTNRPTSKHTVILCFKLYKVRL